MVPVTVNRIRDGIIAALEVRYPDIPVTADEGGEVATPRFYAALAATEQVALLGPRSRRTHTFDIHYYADEGGSGGMHAIAEQLYERLEWIEVDGMKYRGIGMNHEIVDGVLHFKVEFRYNVIRAEEAVPLMQTMKQEEYVKDGNP